MKKIKPKGVSFVTKLTRMIMAVFALTFSSSVFSVDVIQVDSAFTAFGFDGSGFDATRTVEPTYVYANGMHNIYYAGEPFNNG